MSSIKLHFFTTIIGPKHIFVFTDGYSTSGLRLSKALSRAVDEGVDVVGIGKKQYLNCLLIILC